MDIIIVGAGQVGSSVAENLVSENNNVTIIDVEPNRLRQLQNRLDIRTIEGCGSYPTVLKEAGADDADMLIAVSSSDEVNMIACQVAQTIFRIPTKIARIRSQHYFVSDELFSKGELSIDFFISPEKEITSYLQSLIDFPGALQVLDFAKGKVRLVALKPLPNGPLIGKSLQSISASMPNILFQVVAIYRNDRSLTLTPETTIMFGDEVFFIVDSQYIHMVMTTLQRFDHPNRRIMIAGGGNIGRSLAIALQDQYQVKLIDHNLNRTYEIAQILDKTTVLLGDAADRELLVDENIAHTDVFCALTNDDEANIMSAIQAKRLGARQVLALITRRNYVDLIEGGDIDIAISPQQITINGILTHLRQGDVVHVYSLRRGAAEAIEVIAHGDAKTSKVVGRKISEIKLPPGAHVGAIVRDDQTIISQPDATIETNDHVILFLTEKKYIHDVERLFQVNIMFF